MNELLELLESTKNNGIEVSVPLSNIIEECLVEVKHSDDFLIHDILYISNRIINCYVTETGTTYLNTVDNSQIIALETSLKMVDKAISVVGEFTKEFNLFCKKAFDIISWYIETIPY